jgi:hypothetical protein
MKQSADKSYGKMVQPTREMLHLLILREKENVKSRMIKKTLLSVMRAHLKMDASKEKGKSAGQVKKIKRMSEVINKEQSMVKVKLPSNVVHTMRATG